MNTKILWMTPNKPDNISIGRRRIQEGLRNRGYTVVSCMDRKIQAKIQWNGDFDVFISSTAAGGLFGPLAKAQNIAFIMDHVDPISQMYKTAPKPKAVLADILQRIAFRVCDGVLYVYDKEKERVSKHNSNVTQTTLGVDYERFASTPNPMYSMHVNNILTKHNVNSEFIVYTGGLEPIYNIPMMCDAAKDGGWSLVIAGCGYYEDLVIQYANEYENIHYPGVIDHKYIPALLHKASAGICLVNDPHTTKILEYAAVGLPIIHVDGRANGNLPNKGVFYTDCDIQDITNTVSTALQTSFNENILKGYAKKRDYTRVIDQYETMITGVL